MATELPRIEMEPVRASKKMSFLDDEDIDPFMFDDAYYEEEQAEAWAAQAKLQAEQYGSTESTTVDEPPVDAMFDGPSNQLPCASIVSHVAQHGIAQATRANTGRIPATPLARDDPFVPYPELSTPKRRRLHTKSTVPVGFPAGARSPDTFSTPAFQSGSGKSHSSKSQDDDEEGYLAAGDDDLVLPIQEWREMRILAYNSVRRYFYNTPFHSELKKLRRPPTTGKQKKLALYKKFAGLSKNDLAAVATAAATSSDLTEEEKKAVHQRYVLQSSRAPIRSKNVKDDCFFQATFGLFTYHADKWLYERPSWMRKPVSEVTELCKTDAEMHRAWAAIIKDLQRFGLCHYNPKFGAALELCTESYQSRGEIRLHLHIAWKWTERQHIRTPATFKIDDVVPVHVKQPPRDCIGPRAKNVNPMFYYLEMPKIGGVFHKSNERAYTDYSVNPRWITGWLQGKKITGADASKVTVFYIFVSMGARSPTF